MEAQDMDMNKIAVIYKKLSKGVGAFKNLRTKFINYIILISE